MTLARGLERAAIAAMSGIGGSSLETAGPDGARRGGELAAAAKPRGCRSGSEARAVMASVQSVPDLCPIHTEHGL